MVPANQAKLALSSDALRGLLGPWLEGDGPVSTRLARALQRAIERGELLPETRLPPERDLAGALAVGRSTVAAAYGALLRAEVVARRQGSGTWITAPALGNAADELASRSPHRLASLVGADEKGTINLMPGSFGAPRGTEDLLAEADGELARAMRDRGYLPQGYAPLRAAIAARLTARGLPTDEAEILITTGAQQGIALTALALTRAGDFVMLEDPTFVGGLDAYLYAGARLLPVPMTPSGLNLDAAGEALGRVSVRLIYVMPTYHNPTGVVMPLEARQRLIALAEHHDAVVVEDDTEAELALDGVPTPPPLARFDRGARVVFVGSLSKIFWGGLRVGWVRAPARLLGQLAHAKGVLDLGSPLPSQVLATVMLRHGDELRRRRLMETSEAMDALGALMRQHLPTWSFTLPRGGLFLWPRLPHGSATDLARVARRHGVAVLPGTAASPSGGADDRIRMPCTNAKREMSEGIRRLARAWQAYEQATPLRSRVIV